MRNRAVQLIAKKELLDTLRDRRTLFIALLLPILLYPALLLGLTGIIGATQRNLAADAQKVLLDGVSTSGELGDLLREQTLDPIEADSEAARLPIRIAELLGEIETSENGDGPRARLRKILKKNSYAGAIVCQEGFERDLTAGKRTFATLVFDSTDEASKVARAKVARALAKLSESRREELKKSRPDQIELLRFAEAPVERKPVELASISQRGAYSFAPMLGLLIVVMALTGAFYPAVDLAAGEKERGTLETLLVAPVSRQEIVLGKFVAIWIIAIVTALLNLAVMGLTFSKLAGMVGGGSKIAFDLPFSAVVIVSVILVPTAALFSAIALALSSFATSYKEGQHYMSPLFLAAMPLAMVALLPNIELGYGIALVPVANVVLLVKSMLLGGQEMGPALVAIAAMVFYAAVSIALAVSIFKRESVLFRTGSGRGFDASSLRASRAGLPLPAHGFLAFFITIALMFYLSRKLNTGAEIVVSLLVLQFGGVLAPACLLAAFLKLRKRATFGLRAPSVPQAALGFLSGASVVIPVIALTLLVAPPSPNSELKKMMLELQRAVPTWAFIALLAVVPPICEELLCRGFILSSLRERFDTRGAVLISSALFAVLHMDPLRLLPTFLAGLVLGCLMVRSGSIVVCILAHAGYNGVIASAQVMPELAKPVLSLDLAGKTLVVGVALLVFGVAFSIFWRLSPSIDTPKDGDTLNDSTRP